MLNKNFSNRFNPNFKGWLVYLFILIILCVLLGYLGYLLYPKIIQYYTPEPNYNGKTFISVWVQKPDPLPSTNNYWGLGDTVRGTILLYQLSKQFKFNLYIDISRHPISKFLKYPSNHPHKQLLEKHNYKTPFIGSSEQELLDYFRTEFANRDIIWGLTNATRGNIWVPKIPIDKDIQQILQQIFQPTPQLEQNIQTYLNKIPKSFVALHYRVGDSDLLHQTNQIDENTAIQHVQKRLKPNTVFFSDSQTLKNMIRKHFKDVIVFDHEIGHVGVETDEQKICNTLIEFFILSKAKSIHTINYYDWISNFTNIVHKISNIPLTFEKGDLDLSKK
jgi:hypothetical protein